MNIFIVDPNLDSLNIARERYESISGTDSNIVSYSKSLDDVTCTSKIDIVIIATASNVRAEVTVDLLKKFEVKTIIFEKILFQKRNDYFLISELLKNKNVNAYVNCPMRMMSFYNEIQSSFKGTKFTYIVSKIFGCFCQGGLILGKIDNNSSVKIDSKNVEIFPS